MRRGSSARHPTGASLRRSAFRATIAEWKAWAGWVLDPEAGDSWEQIDCESMAAVVQKWRCGRTQTEQVYQLAKLLEAFSGKVPACASRLRWIMGETRKLLRLYGGGVE
jgi:hypothetical protein